MIDVGAIGQDHVSEGALLLILAECLERDFLPIDQFRGGLLRSLAVGLALLGTVDPAEADPFRVLVVEDYEGVTAEDSHHLTGEITRRAVGR